MVQHTGMRLSEFIQDTLYEIAIGVEMARLKSCNYVAINPVSISGERVDDRSYVDFDVSIIVGETEEKSGSGKGRIHGEIKVASLAKAGVEVGGQGQKVSSAKAEQTHRVSFKVPFYMNANYRDNPAVQAEADRFEREGL